MFGNTAISNVRRPTGDRRPIEYRGCLSGQWLLNLVVASHSYAVGQIVWRRWVTS